MDIKHQVSGDIITLGIDEDNSITAVVNWERRHVLFINYDTAILFHMPDYMNSYNLLENLENMYNHLQKSRGFNNEERKKENEDS